MSTSPPTTDRIDPADPSLIRRLTMWWFDDPASPYVSVNIAVDATEARAYLARLAAGDGPRVSVQHLLASVVGRCLSQWPQANARIIGRRIVPQDRVNIAMPVNLLGHEGGKTRELSMAVIEDVSRMTLRDVAGATSRTVAEERKGKTQNAFLNQMMGVLERLPEPGLRAMLDGLDRARNNPVLARAFYKQMPATTGLTNPGSTFAQIPGVLFRGGAFTLPHRLVHIGTLWGVSAIQDEVVAIDGKPEVRAMLPVLLVFDHRLIDGVMASRVLKTFAEVFTNPEAAFGRDGRRLPQA